MSPSKYCYLSKKHWDNLDTSVVVMGGGASGVVLIMLFFEVVFPPVIGAASAGFVPVLLAFAKHASKTCEDREKAKSLELGRRCIRRILLHMKDHFFENDDVSDLHLHRVTLFAYTKATPKSHLRIYARAGVYEDSSTCW